MSAIECPKCGYQPHAAENCRFCPECGTPFKDFLLDGLSSRAWRKREDMLARQEAEDEE